MRRAAVLLACLAALVLASSSPAKLIRVQITSSGFSPGHVTLSAGDSLGWVNNDSSDHRLTCKTCRFVSTRLKKHDTYSYTFLHPGTFTITDTLGHKTFKVTVKPAAATVSITAAPTSLAYGKGATIVGEVSSKGRGASVEILAQKCIASTVDVVAKVRSKKGGGFTYHTRPGIATTYHARYVAPSGTVLSSIVQVHVAPIVTLKRAGGGKYTASVIAGRPLVGKAITFQRFLRKQGRWITSKTVVLSNQHAASTPLKKSVVSSATFVKRFPKGTKVRALIRTLQVVPCYSTAWSKTVTA